MMDPFSDAMEKILWEFRDFFKQEVRSLMAHLANHTWTQVWMKFGSYEINSGVGPYQAWPQLAQVTQDDRVSLGYTPNDPLVRSGELRESVKYKSGWRWAEVGTNNKVMLYHELGSSDGRHPPQRAIFGPVLLENEEKFKDMIDLHMKTLLQRRQQSVGPTVPITEISSSFSSVD